MYQEMAQNGYCMRLSIHLHFMYSCISLWVRVSVSVYMCTCMCMCYILAFKTTSLCWSQFFPWDHSHTFFMNDFKPFIHSCTSRRSLLVAVAEQHISLSASSHMVFSSQIFIAKLLPLYFLQSNQKQQQQQQTKKPQQKQTKTKTSHVHATF